MRLRKTSTETKFTDPVCGMTVDPLHSPYFFIYQNNSYFFCADACLKLFKKDPDKFQNSEPGKPKNWWRRYTAKVDKATGSKPFKCH